MADAPRRIKLSRAKGWCMAPNTVHVARPSRWGNPWTWGRIAPGGPWEVRNLSRDRRECLKRTEEAARAQAIAYFRDACTPPHRAPSGSLDFDPREIARLRGKNLACWCCLNQPCHADVLLELANAPLRCEAADA
jgi:hypothetical protein